MNEWYVVTIVDGSHRLDMVVTEVNDEIEAGAAALKAAYGTGRWTPFAHVVGVEHRILTAKNQLDNPQ